MPSYPGSLSLTNIADGALAVAADERNNFAAIQSGFNNLLTAINVTAKGDILAATGSGAVVNVAIGTNGQVLLADSTQASGVRWGPTYTAYTPTWTSTGSAPAIGNATVTARYVQLGKFVHAYGSIVFGSTSTFGTGDYRFALPVTASSALAVPVLGTGYLLRSSTSAVGVAVCKCITTATHDFEFGATYLGTVTGAGQLTPWTWTTSDQLGWSFAYEAA